MPSGIRQSIWDSFAADVVQKLLPHALAAALAEEAFAVLDPPYSMPARRPRRALACESIGGRGRVRLRDVAEDANWADLRRDPSSSRQLRSRLPADLPRAQRRASPRRTGGALAPPACRTVPQSIHSWFRFRSRYRRRSAKPLGSPGVKMP